MPCIALTGRLAGITLVMAALAGCGGDAEEPTPVEVAQARVDAAKEDLAEAEDVFADDSESFCTDAEEYVRAVDRYGDVLSQTAVTVGDVEDAGSDLAEPREDVMSAAETALDSHADVLAAEEALAEAKADLAVAKNPDTPQPDAPSETAGPEPLLPPATTSRVEQAEQELEAVRRGISDRTPLKEASQQFNAAVVAVEMSWLRLFADAGCLADEQQVEAQAAVREYTTTLQSSLQAAGYYSGEVDGVYGPQTVDAVESLQEAHGLPVTGTVDKATADALEAELAAAGGASEEAAVASVAAVQQTLKLAGFWDGPVDGEWTDALTEALVDFQTALGVEPTGTVDAATVRAVERAIAEAVAEEEQEDAEEEAEDEAEDEAEEEEASEDASPSEEESEPAEDEPSEPASS